MAKKRSKREEIDDEDENDSGVEQPKADAYTGLVVITTICLLVAAIMFYLDGDKFANAKPANPSIAPNPLVNAQKTNTATPTAQN